MQQLTAEVNTPTSRTVSTTFLGQLGPTISIMTVIMLTSILQTHPFPLAWYDAIGLAVTNMVLKVKLLHIKRLHYASGDTFTVRNSYVAVVFLTNMSMTIPYEVTFAYRRTIVLTVTVTTSALLTELGTRFATVL